MAVSRLKLRAHDVADLAVLSVALQDALVAVRDMAWLPKEHRFIILANRFCWEAEPEATPAEATADPGDEGDVSFAGASATLFNRVNCGVCFDRVLSAKSRNLDRRQLDQLLNLLAIKSDGHILRLIFSGGAEVRLELARVAVHLEDLGEAWPTHWRPSHTLDDSGQAG